MSWWLPVLALGSLARAAVGRAATAGGKRLSIGFLRSAGPGDLCELGGSGTGERWLAVPGLVGLPARVVDSCAGLSASKIAVK